MHLLKVLKVSYNNKTKKPPQKTKMTAIFLTPLF